MNYGAFQQAIQNQVKAALSYDGSKVIWSDQTLDRPARPFVELSVLSFRDLSHHSMHGVIDNPDSDGDDGEEPGGPPAVAEADRDEQDHGLDAPHDQHHQALEPDVGGVEHRPLIDGGCEGVIHGDNLAGVGVLRHHPQGFSPRRWPSPTWAGP